jgi:hypothetical protein
MSANQIVERGMNGWQEINNSDGSGRGLILKYYLGTCLDKLRKITQNVSHDYRCPSPESNRAFPFTA